MARRIRSGSLRANIDETESSAIITEQGARRIIVSEAKMAVPFVTSSPDPEVPAKAQRRRFSVEDKKRILSEVERAAEHGGIGAVLRREGIYSSTLHSWRKERDAAVHQAFARKRGPQTQRNPLVGENEKLRRQNQRLQQELEKAHIVIDVQKKVATLLGHPIPEMERS
jgi:transposase